MAIPFIRANTIGIAQGSAVKAAAYRSGEKLRQEKTGEVANYNRKQGILYTSLIMPDHFPDWTRNRAKLWNAVEKRESRKNARYSKELVIALPHELDLEQQIDLLETYVRDTLIPLGIGCDIAIHTPETKRRKYERDREGNLFEDRRNIHAHVMMTDRPMNKAGKWIAKNDKLNKPSVLKKFKKRWELAVNRKLEACGFDERIDFRSYKEQGSDKLAQKHEGKKISGLRKKDGKVSDYIEDETAAEHYQQVIDENDLRREHNKRIDEIAEVEDDTEAANKLDELKEEYNNISKWQRYSETFSHNQPTKEQDNQPNNQATNQPAEPAEPSKPKSWMDKAKSKLRLGAEQWADYEDKSRQLFDYNSHDYEQQTWDSYQANQQPITPDHRGSDYTSQSPPTRDRIRQPLNTQDSREAANDNTNLELEALGEAYKAQNRYRSIDNRSPKTAVDEYRLKLAELTSQSKPDIVVRNYREMNDDALDLEKRIRNYLRGKGFNTQQILKAMRTASPAVYKKDEQIAGRYARKFNQYIRQLKKTHEREKQLKHYQSRQQEKAQKLAREEALKHQQKQDKNRGRGRRF